MIRQRKVPVKPWQSCGVWTVVLGLLPAAGCLFALGAYRGSSQALAVAGLLLAVMALAIVIFMLTRLRPARVDASGEAHIVRRARQEAQIEAAGGPHLLDLFLNAAVWSFLQARSVYDHSLVFVFSAVGTGGETQKITLSAKVSKELYERYAPGTTVGLEYATADPTYALLEGEHGYLGEDVLYREAESRPHDMATSPGPGDQTAAEADLAQEEETDQGAVAGIVCGLLASALGVFLSSQVATGFTESFPILCIPISAIYCVPMGIGGARLGERIGRMDGSQPTISHSIAGALSGGVLGFVITLILVRLFLVLGQ